MMHYPTVNDNADLEFLLTPQCKVRNSSYEFAMRSKYYRDLTGWYNLPITRNICVPRLFYARILLFTAVFGHFFFALKYRERLWEILRDSKFQNPKVILVRFRAFMTETFERHRSNQNRNMNWNEQKIWETFQKIMRA